MECDVLENRIPDYTDLSCTPSDAERLVVERNVRRVIEWADGVAKDHICSYGACGIEDIQFGGFVRLILGDAYGGDWVVEDGICGTFNGACAGREYVEFLLKPLFCDGALAAEQLMRTRIASAIDRVKREHEERAGYLMSRLKATRIDLPAGVCIRQIWRSRATAHYMLDGLNGEFVTAGVPLVEFGGQYQCSSEAARVFAQQHINMALCGMLNATFAPITEQADDCGKHDDGQKNQPTLRSWPDHRDTAA